jgi:hypothetical protein
MTGNAGNRRSRRGQSERLRRAEGSLGIAALPFIVGMPIRPDDERHLVAAIALARRSREKGSHPFGSLLVDAKGHVVLEAENTAVAGGDWLGYAELNLVRASTEHFRRVSRRLHALHEHRALWDVRRRDLLVGHRTRRLRTRRYDCSF